MPTTTIMASDNAGPVIRAKGKKSRSDLLRIFNFY